MAITVYYATNRNETGTDASPSFGPHFHQKGPQYLRFGSADVEPPTTPGGDYRVVTVRLAPRADHHAGRAPGAWQPPNLRRAANPHEG